MINADNMIQANNLEENPGLIPKKVSFIMRKIETPNKRKGRKGKLLEEISNSNENLITNLENLNSTANCLKDKDQFRSVTSLVDELTDLKHQVESEKSDLRDLVQQIHKLENLKKKTSRRLGGKYRATHVDDVKEVDKSRERWQEKLRVESVHLGNEMTKNKELREKVKCMMSERSKFNKDYNDLLEKLKSGKTIMQDVVESVKLAEGRRKNILTKIEKINFQENKQINLQKEEAYSLIMRKDNERALQKFHFNKQKERKCILRGQEQAKAIPMSDETVLNDYRNLMLAIVEKCGEHQESISYDGIVKQLSNNESEILSLFKYANHLKHEMEVLSEKLVEQGKQINDMTSDQEMKTICHEEELKYLTALKVKVEEDEVLSKEDMNRAERLLARLFEGIEHLIRTTNADILPLLLLLGENEKVTVFNYKLFIEALETKLIEFMNFIPLQSNLSPSIVSFSKGTFLKGKTASSIRRPEQSVDMKLIVTSPCEDCIAYKKEIAESSKRIINGARVKVY